MPGKHASARRLGPEQQTDTTKKNSLCESLCKGALALRKRTREPPPSGHFIRRTPVTVSVHEIVVACIITITITITITTTTIIIIIIMFIMGCSHSLMSASLHLLRLELLV